jgi:rod shape determining protein RodA
MGFLLSEGQTVSSLESSFMGISKYLPIRKGFDWPLFVSSLFLVFLGLSVIYSTSLAADSILFEKQVIFLVVGLVMLFIFSSVDYRKLGSYWWALYVFSLLLLGSVLVFGTSIRGTKGWFVWGTFSFQPVEIVKVFIVIILSYFLSKHSISSWRDWGRSFLLIVPVIGLLYLQPDFGPIFIIVIIWLLFNILRGLSKQGWLILISSLVFASLIVWFGILRDDQKARIETFINPSLDPTGQGFQVRQSIIAIGSGQILGSGLGEGGQSELRFLPEAPTDFVFASLLEQLGLIGFLVLLGIWLVFFWRTIKIVRSARDDYTLYISLGLMLLIFIQTFINVAMNLGLAPVVGLPLPFLSYGGSALVSTFILVGILENIAMRQKL